MPCTHPVTAWRSKEVNANGNRPLVFAEHKGVEGSQLKIPCHQCTGCRIDHGSGWAIRLMHESRFHVYCSFLTMTYRPECLPEHQTLVKRDVQLFYKRLRKEYPNIRIRHFTVGEYGDKNGRPHYHAIVFGVAFLEDRRPHSKNALGDQLYTSKTLDRIWGKGDCQIGTVSPQSCGYVAGYAFKKINGKRADEHYRRVDPATGETWMLQKEFSLMSTHPGIGHTHYELYRDQMYRRGSVISKGRELPIPKYYDRLLKRDDPLRLESIKTGRFEDAMKHAEDQTPERLAVKEEILLAKRREYVHKDL
jgi:hypothetical protein